MENLKTTMPRSEHVEKATEVVEIFKAWKIGKADTLQIIEEMRKYAWAQREWIDPLEGTPYSAHPFKR